MCQLDVNDQRHVIIRVLQDLLPHIVYMKPLNPLKPPLPFTLSDAPSSVVFFSLGLSLMFCAPPRVVKVRKPVLYLVNSSVWQSNSPRP